MKGLKKLLTTVLAGAMAFTMAFGTGSAVKAEAANYTITVNNPSAGQEYTLYKVFDFEPSQGTETAGVYTINDAWKGVLLNSEGQLVDSVSDYISIDANGIVSWKGTVVNDTTGKNTDGIITDAQAFAEVLNELAPDEAKVGEPYTATEDDVKNKSFKFTVNALGYYMVSSTLGALVSLDTTTPNAVIYEKNDTPNLDKTVDEDSYSGKYDRRQFIGEQKGNDAEIGQTINYQIVVDLKKGGTDYKVVDTMTAGLTLDKGSYSYEYDVEEATVPTVTKEEDHAFEITFTNPTADVKVTIHYTAKLNENAVINTGVNTNEAYLEYNNGATTTHKKTDTKTYPARIVKYDSSDENMKAIAGAIFTLQNAAGDYLTFTNSEATYKVSGTVKVSEGENVPENAKITTIASTPIDILGLDSDSYTLTEIQAPEGYNILTAPEQFTVSSESTLNDLKKLTTVDVPNSKGTLLPSTGGIGTTIFYIIGGILIVAGVAYFIVRRKQNAE